MFPMVLDSPDLGEAGHFYSPVLITPLINDGNCVLISLCLPALGYTFIHSFNTTVNNSTSLSTQSMLKVVLRIYSDESSQPLTWGTPHLIAGLHFDRIEEVCQQV